MASTINASTTSGLVQTADTSGVLQFQTGGNTFVTIGTTGRTIINADNNLALQLGVFTTSVTNANIIGGIRSRGTIASQASSTTGDTNNIYAAFYDAAISGTGDPNVYNYISNILGATGSTTGRQTSMAFLTNNSTSQYGLEAARFDFNQYLLVGYTTSNGAYKLQVNSQIFATSATIATSDARYKTNVEPITDGLSIVNSLKPVQFDWKKHPIHNFDTEYKTVGFLAQEVQEVLKDKPYLNSIIKSNTCTIKEAVIDEEGKEVEPAVTEEFLGIAEGNMIAILTSAIQEQQTIINDLKARIEILEGAK